MAANANRRTLILAGRAGTALPPQSSYGEAAIGRNYSAESQKARSGEIGPFRRTGRLPTLPHTCACSTIGAEGLNYRVRDGNGWVLLARVTQKLDLKSVQKA